jgi:hypothetical protein
MAIKGIAANIPIKGVDFVEYYYTLSGTTHTVTVVLNKHIYGGRFSDTTEAGAFNKAKELVKGCLVKSGCFKPDTRIDNIQFKKYGFPVAPLVDVTPNSVNWNPIIGVEFASSNTQTITGISSPITLEISWTPTDAFSNLNWKLIDIVVAGEATNLTTSGETLVVSNGNSIYFEVFVNGPIEASATVTVKNITDSNTILDTFIVNVLPAGEV